MSPEEIRAAAEIHHELGPAYQDAVIESFLDKVGMELDARVDVRLAAQRAAQSPAASKSGPPHSPMTLAIISVALGVPFSAIVVAAGKHWSGALTALMVAWIAIINIVYTVGHRTQPHHGPDSRSCVSRSTRHLLRPWPHERSCRGCLPSPVAFRPFRRRCCPGLVERPAARLVPAAGMPGTGRRAGSL
jgi:hypothetical protein